jgi:hypothetical protein
MPSPTPRKAGGVPRAGGRILLMLLGKTGAPPRLCLDRLEYLQNQRFVFA